MAIISLTYVNGFGMLLLRQQKEIPNGNWASIIKPRGAWDTESDNIWAPLTVIIH